MPQGSGGMAQQNLFFVLTSWSFILPWGDFPSPFKASQQDLLEVLPSSKVFSLDLMTGLSQHVKIMVPFKLGLQKELSLAVKGLDLFICPAAISGTLPTVQPYHVTWPWARTHAEEFPLRWGKLQQLHFCFMPLLRLLLGLAQR